MRSASNENPLLKECVSITSVELNGVPVAADYIIHIVVNGYDLGVIRSAPFLLDYAATGLALLQSRAVCGDYVVAENIYEDDSELVFQGSLRRRNTKEACLGVPRRVGLGLLERIYRDFVTRLPKRGCPLAVHRLALYSLSDSSFSFQFFVADPSRHSAAYKLAGMVSALADKISGLPGVVVSTGRLSDDMVRVLARVGVRVIVSFHHPLLSGLREAEKRDVTLVLRDPISNELRGFTSLHRLGD